MAEGWTRQSGKKWLAVQSAGIEQHGKNPRAIEVMQEAGVNISRQESTQLTDEMLALADVVVTVCGHADENCPVLAAGKRKEHWPLEDPAEASGSDDEILAVFRASRDDIRRRVVDLIERLAQESETRR